jgi:hypothetical protein
MMIVYKSPIEIKWLSTLTVFSFCAVVLIVLSSFPSVAGYQQKKSNEKSQNIKGMLQIVKSSPNYTKNLTGIITLIKMFIIFMINFIGLVIMYTVMYFYFYILDGPMPPGPFKQI